MATKRILGDIIPRILLSACVGFFVFLFSMTFICPTLARSFINNIDDVAKVAGGVIWLEITAVILQSVFGEEDAGTSKVGAVELFAGLITSVAIIVAMVKCP